MSCRRAVCELRSQSSLIQSRGSSIAPGNSKRSISSGGRFRRETHRSLLDAANDKDKGGSESADEIANRVTLSGLVRSVRKQKRVAFAHIQDGTTYEPIQAIIDPGLAIGITNGAYVELSGRWERSKGKGQAFELQVEQIDKIGESNADENPIQKQSMTAEYLRTMPHMRMRTPFQSLLARARSRLIRSAADYFDTLSPPAIQVHPPLITSSDCEGAGEVFTLSPQSYICPPESGQSSTSSQTKDTAKPDPKPKQFFREPKYLTVSSQLHLEAWSAELGNVWTLSPTFRAEESDTSRHLAEFYMLEAEFRGTNSLDTVTKIAEDLIKSLTLALANHPSIGTELLTLYADRKHRPEDVELPDLTDRWSRLTKHAFLQVTYTDAVRELSQAAGAGAGAAASTFTVPPTWHGGLALEHERWLVENLGHGRPVIVTDYPKAQKPFYMLPSASSSSSCSSSSSFPPGHDYGVDNAAENAETETETETVACFDILLPLGYAEVCGGSLREHRLRQLIKSMRAKQLLVKSTPATGTATATAQSPPSPSYPYLQPGEHLGSLQWYADLRRFGSSPHGGFGLGFDRLLAYLSGRPSVRDVVGFPRYWGRADC